MGEARFFNSFLNHRFFERVNATQISYNSVYVCLDLFTIRQEDLVWCARPPIVQTTRRGLFSFNFCFILGLFAQYAYNCQIDKKMISRAIKSVSCRNKYLVISTIQ